MASWAENEVPLYVSELLCSMFVSMHVQHGSIRAECHIFIFLLCLSWAAASDQYLCGYWAVCLINCWLSCAHSWRREHSILLPVSLQKGNVSYYRGTVTSFLLSSHHLFSSLLLGWSCLFSSLVVVHLILSSSLDLTCLPTSICVVTPPSHAIPFFPPLCPSFFLSLCLIPCFLVRRA